MPFNEESDTYTCVNNQKLEFKYMSKQKIEVDVYWKRKFMNVIIVWDALLQENVKIYLITKNFM